LEYIRRIVCRNGYVGEKRWKIIDKTQKRKMRISVKKEGFWEGVRGVKLKLWDGGGSLNNNLFYFQGAVCQATQAGRQASN
jgi:hypothetical protein